MSHLSVRLRNLGLGLVVVLLLVVVTAVTAQPQPQPHIQTTTSPLKTFVRYQSIEFNGTHSLDSQLNLDTHRLYITYSFRQKVYALDSLTGEVISHLETPTSLTNIQLNQDGTRLYSWDGTPHPDSEQRLYLIDTTQNQIVFSTEQPNYSHSLTVGPDNTVYTIPASNDRIDLYNGDTGSHTTSILINPLPAGSQFTGLLNHGHHLLVSQSYTNTNQTMTKLILLDLTQFPPQEILSSNLPEAYQLIAYSFDGAKILTKQTNSSQLALLDAATLLPDRTIPLPEGADDFQNPMFSIDDQSVLFQDNVQIWAYDLVSDSWSHHYDRLENGEQMITTLENSRFATSEFVNIHFYLAANSTTHLPAVQKNYCSSPVEDDFSNPASGWPVGENAFTILRYQQGQYNIYHKDGYRWTAVTRNDSWNFGSEFQLEAGMVSGDGTFGLIYGLNSDWSDFYTIEFDQKAMRMYHFHYNADSGWTLLRSYAHLEHQLLPVGHMNEITIDRWGTTINLNDRSFFAMPALRNGRIGFTAGSFARNTDMRFDNYKFSLLGCPSVIGYWESIPPTLDMHLDQRDALLAPYILLTPHSGE